MPPLTVTDHRLFVYLFAPLTGASPTSANDRAHLRDVWHTLAERLQLRAAGPGRALPLDPPDQDDQFEDATLAGRSDPGTALREMWWDQTRDLACVSLTLSHHGRPSAGWVGLHQEWADAIRGLDLAGLLGQVEILTALTASTMPADDSTTAAIATDLPPDTPVAVGWQTNAAVTIDGIGVWQLSPADSEDALRRLVVLAPEATDGEGGAFADLVWRPGLSRLGRYLLHGARLRYQARVLHHDRDGIHDQRIQVGHTLTDLQPVLSDAADTWDDTTLRGKRRKLARLQAGTSGLVDTLTQIAAMRRTITIAAANMTTLTTGMIHPDHATLLQHDQTLAHDIDIELDDEATYLHAANQRAHQYIDVIDRILTRRQHDLDQQNQHRQQQFTLFETAIIGAIVMALTAIQAFDYKVTLLPAATQPATIVGLTAVAFLLATIALRRAAMPYQPRPHHRTGWLTGLFATAAGALAAATVWFVTSWFSQLPTTWPSTTLLIVPSGAAAAFILTAATTATTLGLRQRHRHHTQSHPQIPRQKRVEPLGREHSPATLDETT